MASDAGRSGKRDQAIAAATHLFLHHGFDQVGMDHVALRAGVAKQTIYAHFGSKQRLFVEVVSAMTRATTGQVARDAPTAPPSSATTAQITDYLTSYGIAQLAAVLHPDVVRLRRLVISEVDRFPDLATVLHDEGPARAIAHLSQLLQQWTDQLPHQPPAPDAAVQLNWLFMGQPLNQAMLLGTGSAPTAPEALRAHCAQAVTTAITAWSNPDHDDRD